MVMTNRLVDKIFKNEFVAATATVSTRTHHIKQV